MSLGETLGNSGMRITDRPRRGALGLALALASVTVLAGCGNREVILPGERFGTRVPLVETLSGGASAGAEEQVDAARAINLPAASTYASWTQRGFDAQNRTPHAALSASPTQVWSANIGQGNSRRNRITADPVAGSGAVFTLDASAGVRAHSISSGGLLWSADLTAGFDRGGNVSGGGLSLDGDTLYATTGYGELVALDASSGAVRWRQRLGAGLGTPTVSGNSVFVVSRDNRAWAISTDVGRIQWELPSAPAQALRAGGAAPAVADGTVIFPYGSGELVAARRDTGVRTWATAVAGGRLGVAYSNISDITGDPVVAGGTVYAGNQSGRVVALSAATGERRWTATEGAYSPVLVAGGSLFFVSDRNELIRLDAETGDRIWGTELPLYVRERERRRRAVFTHYGPILAGGRLVVASGDNQIRFFDPVGGNLVGSVNLRGGAASHPIVVNNTLMVVTGDGRLVAYR
ncbi:PQQ-binding-like beta-propeller repeat protein [Roseibacterium sp. SDUM158016]|uniref:outer membrane protein assembly factor BamB family protein n=1 Tax=Roseicyclus sediminis TaxID=2980997 RepID=UPI0021CE32E5|nr:PQQ-binding-like beta-propeller repeat protein [Roseibacterium sp. SDUM158016]MCU4651848.1 PQQ-binding-like beta-propeller repeat protein [Roseibacterium sp. SDUM158016]